MIKRTFAVVSILLLPMLTSYGQQKTMYVGTSISLHHEIRNKMIYGPGIVNRTSATSFLVQESDFRRKLVTAGELTQESVMSKGTMK